ncbi:hypothetical protein AVEN_60112-1 [Araneus ventricosus]|uniref:Uncharacterized protein n=1 Tax=Araneus ventricosus TaxID=182803 RepID=A0A4Y2QTQ2_ARAVE|nr:hypothetical protein AVEN_60112-1 [Araneus ventricosus]
MVFCFVDNILTVKLESAVGTGKFDEEGYNIEAIEARDSTQANRLQSKFDFTTRGRGNDAFLGSILECLGETTPAGFIAYLYASDLDSLAERPWQSFEAQFHVLLKFRLLFICEDQSRSCS